MSSNVKTGATGSYIACGKVKSLLDQRMRGNGAYLMRLVSSRKVSDSEKLVDDESQQVVVVVGSLFNTIQRNLEEEKEAQEWVKQ